MFISVQKIGYLCIATALLLTAACTAENPAGQNGSLVKVELLAGTDTGDLSSETKTTIHKQLATTTRSVAWEKGDKILFWHNSGSVIGEAAATGKNSTISVELPIGDYTLYGVYPSTTTVAKEGSTFNVTLPQEQSGTFAKSNIALTTAAVSVSSATSSAGNCQFYNATGYIKFVVTDADITKITVESIGGEPLVGTLPITFNPDKTLAIGTATATSTTAALFPDGPGEYYLSTIPGITYASGLRVRFFVDGLEKYSIARGIYNSTDGAITIARSQIASFGELDKRVGIIYASVEGAGAHDGSSLENALSSDELFALLADGSAGTFNRLNGSTIRLASGVYVNSTPPYRVDFAAAGETCAIRFAGGDGVVLSGGNAHAALVLGTNVSAVFSDVTFSHGLTVSNHGACLQVIDGAAAVLTNCAISNNKSGGEFYGAGIYVGNGSTLTAVNCLFSENSGAHACALDVEGGATVSDCSFSANTATSSAGAVALNPSAATTFTDCAFHGNSAQQDKVGSQGGALTLLGGEVSLTGCIFQRNLAYQGGAIELTGNGTMNLEECRFVENGANHVWEDSDATSLGGAVNFSGPSFLKVRHCTFLDNTATRGGAIATQHNDAKLWIDACVFGPNNIVWGHGTNMYLNGCTECAINNTTMQDGGYSTLASNGDWVALNKCTSFLIANSSLAGNPKKSPTDNTGNCGLIWLGHSNPVTAYLINNIIAIPSVNTSSSVKVRDSSHQVHLFGNKQSNWISAGDDGIECTYEKKYGNAEDYYWTNAYFEGIQRISGTDLLWNNTYNKWNGTLLKGSSTSKMNGTDVRNEMIAVMTDFCTWIGESINKDQRGVTRGEQYWPGSYQE